MIEKDLEYDSDQEKKYNEGEYGRSDEETVGEMDAKANKYKKEKAYLIH